MKSIIVLSIILAASATVASAQNRTEDFEITLPEQKIPNSHYRSIAFIDSRYDTSHMGIVQLGAFNKKAKVNPKVPLSNQLTNVLNALVDSSAMEGELLFQLRQFSFAEITGATSERGYCYMRAILYEKNGGMYHKLGTIDTVILIKSFDVTRPLFRRSSYLISTFIADHLVQAPVVTRAFTFNDVLNLDQLEKRDIPVYATSSYKDGLYETYQSFMQQLPDKAIEVTMKKDKISDVKTTGVDGKKEKVRAKEIYAIVHKGQPFIATDYGYYPLQKSGDDFYFTGKAKVTANTGDVIVAGVFFGIIGTLIASDASSLFEMKLDHLNGGFMRIREIKEPTQ